MTPVQIKLSIESGKLQLTRQQKFNHYFPAHAALFAGLCLPIFLILDFITDRAIDSPMSFASAALFSLSFLLPATLLYINSVRVLRLTRVDTSLPVGEIRELLVKAASRHGWSVQNNRKTFMVLKTHPGFAWNWGEKITVLFSRGEVWVNSICDPDFNSAFYSSGRNKNNQLMIQQYLSGNRRAEGTMLSSRKRSG